MRGEVYTLSEQQQISPICTVAFIVKDSAQLRLHQNSHLNALKDIRMPI